MLAFFENQPSGCYMYRIKHPTDLLKSHGVDVTGIRVNQDIDDSVKTFLMYGAYPFSFKKPLEWMKSEGKRIVLDMDDALGLIDETNPMFYQVKKDLGSHLELISHADHITVSTEAMAEYARSKTDKPITVITNCYVPSEWTFPRPKREGFRIGFAGASAHVSDLIPTLPTIKRLQDKYGITFVLFGFGKGTYEQWFKDQRYVGTEQAIKDLELFNELLLPIRYEWIPFVDFQDYPSTLINLSLDIGLCPLKETPFNNCRSASKAMEYTLSGALALASDLRPYRDDMSSVIVGDWESTISWYIENPKALKGERDHCLQWVKENRNINTQLDTLKKVYDLPV